MPAATLTSISTEIRLSAEMARYYADPYGFVMAAYPEGEEGTELEDQTGPDENQTRFLLDLGGTSQRAWLQRQRRRAADPHDRHQRPRNGQERHGGVDRQLDPFHAAGFHRHGHSRYLAPATKPHLGGIAILDQTLHHRPLV